LAYTHPVSDNERLHEVNIGWHSTAEDYLWTPINQEAKVSQGGDHNVRYRTGYKQDGPLVPGATRAPHAVLPGPLRLLTLSARTSVSRL
jgi:hypothetical protein